MLEFLGSMAGGLGSAGSTLGSLAGPVGNIMSIFQALKGPEKVKQPASERYAISLLKALGTPGNSYVKQMQDEEFQNLFSGVRGDIMEKVLADRRERAMGRAGVFFDPERRDENIYQQISRGTPMLKQQASQNAIQRILQAAGVGTYGQSETKRDQLNFAAQAAQKDTMNAMGGYGGMISKGTDALQNILRTFQGKTTQSPNGVIYWD
jgi:hypothetical protein